MSEPVTISVPVTHNFRPQLNALIAVEHVIDYYQLTPEEIREVGRWVLTNSEGLAKCRERGK